MAERQRLCDSRACRSGNVTANRVALLAGIHAGEDRIPASATIAEDRVHRVAVAVAIRPTQRARGRVERRAHALPRVGFGLHWPLQQTSAPALQSKMSAQPVRVVVVVIEVVVVVGGVQAAKNVWSFRMLSSAVVWSVA